MNGMIDFDVFLGTNPAIYGRDVIKGLDLKVPPVDEREVAEFLGYDIHIIRKDGADSFSPKLWNILQTAPAHLFKQQNKILVRGDLMRQRERMCVFHECGHDRLPWHAGLNFACSESALDMQVHQRIEREAFLCGTELMMPLHWFVEDSLSLPMEIDSISSLRYRYNSSMEATAIRYAFTHPKICALLAVEPTNTEADESDESNETSEANEKIPRQKCNTHPMLDLELPPPKNPENTENDIYPLKVIYFVRSHRFRPFIRPGTGIPEGSRIHEAYISASNFRDEISFQELQLKGKGVFQAEGITLGYTGRMLVLLWVKDSQVPLLDYKTGIIA